MLRGIILPIVAKRGRGIYSNIIKTINGLSEVSPKLGNHISGKIKPPTK